MDRKHFTIFIGVILVAVIILLAILLNYYTEENSITEESSFDDEDFSDDFDKFVGLWINENLIQIDTFYSDGSWMHGGIINGGMWHLTDGELIETLDYGDSTIDFVWHYSFSDDNNTLTLNRKDHDRSIVHTRYELNIVLSPDYSAKTLTVTEYDGINHIWEENIRIMGNVSGEDIEMTGSAILPYGTVDVGDVITNCSDELWLVMTSPFHHIFGKWVFNSTINDIVLDEISYQNAPRNPFAINIVVLEGDILKLDVPYWSGLERTEFALIGTSIFRESSPVQIDLILSHDANTSICKIQTEEELNFNLTPLKEAWQEAYQQDSGTIIINLEGYEESIEYNF